MIAAIEIKNLEKRYRNLVAVDHINLTIARGEIFGLLGPNGAGKTTLLMMLSTLLQPSAGYATINGFDTSTQADKVRQSIGMVFQDPSSDELLSGYENLKLHALLYNIPIKSINKRIDEVLMLVDLEKRKHDKVKTYSGGMRRRMEIARGLLHQPEVLFLDEPTLGLDPQTREHIWQYIQSLTRKTGMTVVLTTHYMEEAERLCSRVAIIDHGKIVANDTTENLRQTIAGDLISLKGTHIPLDNLRRLPFVKKIEVLDGRVEITIDNAAKNLYLLLTVAGEIDFIEVRAPDLNDVFLSYTGKEIRESEGGTLEHIRSLTKAKQK
ncbi:ATP-binding cassette domain-containing protein [Chitinophaga sp. Ak27]|uniref:ATP-binding cassette domain-containing protein n=1 Tax=Chitinophaga sp. Ak27 TaxID=2726116 RepID=UPI00145F37A6|nr:ATP-binding cassette domain-containing protein [Chitinophaga sp. Ak27]NLU90538.1 ATP-binding cassette domain-containing protein [Chitinophaga sp. Ak27]